MRGVLAFDVRSSWSSDPAFGLDLDEAGSYSEALMKYHRRNAVMIALCLAGSLMLESQTRADFAEMKLQSQPGDFIGQGGTFDVIYHPTEISAQIIQTLPAGPAELQFVLGNVDPSNDFTLAYFGTNMLGIPIQPGVYGLPGNTAQRSVFAQPGHPGLDISFQNRGSNTLTGNFTITDVSFYTDASNHLQIATFNASFEQHSEGLTPALFGTFTFQSSAVPEPTASGLVIIGGTLVVVWIGFRGQFVS